MKQETNSHIDAARREVRSLDHEGRPARAVVIERTYDTTVDDVWDAVTNRERIPRWFLPIEGDLRLGGRYQLKGNASGEVTACAPPTHLAVTWEMGDAVSWVDVQLSEDAEGGTRVRLEHVALVEDVEVWEQFGPGAVGIGWDLAFFGLTEHLRTGAHVAVDPEVAASEAAAGGPLAELMARSSDAWREADIAFGTPEEKARAKAANTLAFYTGGGDPLDGDAPPDAQDGSDGGSPSGS